MNATPGPFFWLVHEIRGFKFSEMEILKNKGGVVAYHHSLPPAKRRVLTGSSFRARMRRPSARAVPELPTDYIMQTLTHTRTRTRRCERREFTPHRVRARVTMAGLCRDDQAIAARHWPASVSRRSATTRSSRCADYSYPCTAVLRSLTATICSLTAIIRSLTSIFSSPYRDSS